MKDLDNKANPRAVKAHKDYLKKLELRQEVIKRLKDQAKEELCCNAEVECYYDASSNRIFACCPHSNTCLAACVKDLKGVKEYGVTYDGELAVNIKKSRPMGLGKKRRDQLAEEAKTPKPPKIPTKQVYNNKFKCWETVVIKEDET